MDCLRKRIPIESLTPYIFYTSPITPESRRRKSDMQCFRKIREKSFSLICNIEICLIADDERDIRREDFAYTMIIALKGLDRGNDESSIGRLFSLLPKCIVHILLIEGFENSDFDRIFCYDKKVWIWMIECIFCSQ